LNVPLAAEQASGGGFLTFLPIILLFAAMYFLLIRPQSKRRREAQQLQSRLAPGDEVQTVGGLFGTVVSIDDDAITIEAAPGVNLRYTRGAIARVTKQERPPALEQDDAEVTDVVEDLDTPEKLDAPKKVEQA
jgi:preprotein translocase subunit YajC